MVADDDSGADASGPGVIINDTVPSTPGTLAHAQAGSTPPRRPPRPPVSPFVAGDEDDRDHLRQRNAPSIFDTQSPGSPPIITPNRSTSQVPPSVLTADQSFWRWSSATSSIAPSEYKPPSTYASISERSVPRMHRSDDKSYLRLTRTTIFSDFSAPSTIPDVPDLATLPMPFKRPSERSVLFAIPETSVTSHIDAHKDREEIEAVDVSPVEDGRPKTERRSSAGTFGDKNRRWSAVESTTTITSKTQGHVKDLTDPFQDDVVQRNPPSLHYTRPRPLSFSSASDSAYTDSNYSGPRAMDDTVLAARTAMGMLPSTHKRPVYKQPESEQAITAHLLKQTEKNERRIVPSERGHEGNMRIGSKASRVLGIDIGDVAWHNDQSKVGSTGLPPPPRTYQSSKLFPVQSPRTPMRPLPTTPEFPDRQSSRQTIYGWQEPINLNPLTSFHHAPSASLDSLASLQPSISDSIKTISRLIPKEKPLPPITHRFTHARSQTLDSSPHGGHPFNNELETMTNLTPEQRVLLHRRTRKLEQLLGETLPEEQIGKLVPDSLPSETIETRPRPMNSITVSRPTGDATRIGKPFGKSSGTLARRAKAAFGLHKLKNRSGSEDLNDIANHEQMNDSLPNWDTETRSKTPTSYNHRHKSWTESGPITPRPIAMSGEQSWPSPEIRSQGDAEEEEEDDHITRNKRQQLAKLHRLLGSPISPDMLNSNIQPRSLARTDRAPSPSNQSFMTFDDDEAIKFASTTGGGVGNWSLTKLNG
nr:uncharacterized protein CI109_000665 [Kwoniella shandongensis]KAA5531093.1 hypothetical protein CI109_000665 [Kwoniella shandongensis]